MQNFELIKEDWNEGSPHIVEAHDDEDAIQGWCNEKFSDWDYPKEMTIFVREVGTQEWKRYKIEVQPVPDFILSDPECITEQEALLAGLTKE